MVWQYILGTILYSAIVKTALLQYQSDIICLNTDGYANTPALIDLVRMQAVPKYSPWQNKGEKRHAGVLRRL